MRNILCFGDSNTWGYNPTNKTRFSEDIRWTGILKNSLKAHNINIIEEGLCGRTSIFEDETRPGRRGIEMLPQVLADNSNVDGVILMLGTNDCKTCNHASAAEIAKGIDTCLDIILEYVKAENVLVISPILLGEKVWQPEYDPEFNRHSVEVSKGLKAEYRHVANRRGVQFLAASEYVSPSSEDQEHLNAESHRKFADVLLDSYFKVS